MGKVGGRDKARRSDVAALSHGQALSDAQLLDGLKIAEATVSATREVLQAQVNQLRERETSWQVIGSALGISRQAAWERFS